MRAVDAMVLHIGSRHRRPCFGSPHSPETDTLPFVPAPLFRPANRPTEESTLRIALVIERFIPGAGGVENVAWQVAHELAQQGESVTIIAREAAPSSPLPIVPIFAPATWQPTRLLLFSRGAARATRTGFDIVHSFSHTRHQDLFRAGGGTQIDHLRRNFQGTARRLRKLSPRYRVRLAVEHAVFQNSTQRIQCSSRLVADSLQRDHHVPEDRIFLLPNAVDASAFEGAELDREAQLLRARLSPDGGPVWLFPGSGWHRKGLSTALDVIARCPGQDAHLWVAGRDAIAPWQEQAQALGIAARVHFLGERADLPAVYRAADGVLLPTRYDAFANVTLEAAAAGRPIITTASNGASEWLGDDVHVIPGADDVGGFVAALAELRDPVRARAVGHALGRRAREFSWPAHVSRLRQEYEAILERRKAIAS